MGEVLKGESNRKTRHVKIKKESSVLLNLEEKKLMLKTCIFSEKTEKPKIPFAANKEKSVSQRKENFLS